MGLMGNAPPPLALDFAPKRRRPGWVGWVVLVLGVAALGAVTLSLRAAQAGLAARERIVEGQREAVRAARRANSAAAGSPLPGQVLEPALKVAGALRAPWAAAFGAVANARSEGVALLELHADAGQGSLRLVGHARSLETAFDYVASLQSDPALREVRIDSHEWIAGDEGDRVRFTASARWGNGR